MTVPDFVVMISTLGLSIGILPTIFGKQSPSSLTSICYTICITGIAVGLLYSDLILGGIANGVCALLWGIVSVKSIIRKREERKYGKLG